MTDAHTIRICRSAASAIAITTMLSGCYGEASDADFSKMDAWIPEASVRALPLLSEEPSRWYQRKSASATFLGGQSRATLIGDPENSRNHFAWPSHNSTVTQELLIKSADGRFYSTRYVWTADSITGECSSTPALCASYRETYELGEDEAKNTLAKARQFSPDLYRQFFGQNVPLPKENG